MQARSVVAQIQRQGRRDCMLVSSECGGRVTTHSLLLSLHSPLLAVLLGELGEHAAIQGITLPLTLPQIRGLVSLLQGEGMGKGVTEQEVQKATDLLGIPWQVVKGEILSNLHIIKEEVQDFSDIEGLRSEGPSKRMKVKIQTKEEDKADDDFYYDSDSELEEDDNDPDFNNKVVKSEKNGSKTGNIKRKVGRPTKKDGIRRRKMADSEFSCDHCTMQFQTNVYLMRHQNKAHGVSVHCEKCSEEFSEYHRFQKHMSENHPAYTCPVCGIAKFTKSSLDNHVESQHQDNIPCPQCGIMYTTQASLNLHMGRVHSDKEPEKCSKCDYQTRVPHELKGHYKRRHTEETKETCQYCGDVFKGLKKHQQRTGCGGTRADRKKLPCNHCGKEFYKKANLDKHVKDIHSGVKDRVCPHCPYATYSSFNLRLHISKMHFGTKLEKEVCPHCEKTSTNLKYHIEMYHPILSDSNELEVQL